MLLLASFAASLSSPSGGFLCRAVIPLPTYPLSAIHPEGSILSSSPEGARGGYVVHGARIGVRGPRRAPVGQDQDLGAHAGRPVLTATAIRGDSAGSSGGGGRRPPRGRSPGAPPGR